MRKLLRNIILWALTGDGVQDHDAAGMDRLARETRGES